MSSAIGAGGVSQAIIKSTAIIDNDDLQSQQAVVNGGYCNLANEENHTLEGVNADLLGPIQESIKQEDKLTGRPELAQSTRLPEEKKE